MTVQIAHPKCYVDIYTFEGGFFQLTSANVLNVSVDKDLTADMGTFTLDLAPSGPFGANAPPSWAQVITPMSFVIIGMQRGDLASIVMLGVVQTIGEAEIWTTGQPVQRVIRITGSDMAYFFAMFTYYSLWYLGATGAGVVNLGTNNPAASLPSVMGDALLSGEPADVGNAWFTKIMGGTEGILARSYVPYSTGKVLFPEAVSSFFERYDVTIPYGEYFIASEGSWMEKFRLIFPAPYYEFFVTTATSVTDYQRSGQVGAGTYGRAFSCKGLGDNITAFPVVVARKNPLPQLTAESSDGVPSFSNIDASAWNKLTLYQADGINYQQSQVGFDETQVQNFFVLNPTWMRSLYGQSNDGTIPFIFAFAAAGDAASIARYGFRPGNGSFNWLTDLTGNIASNNKKTDALETLAGTLLARFSSFWSPTPLMLKGTVTMNLRPDILPGNRFRYRPYKSQETWDFYINRVTHNFSYGGGGSTTTLTLSRGLPTSVYADAGGSGMLYNVHIGNAQRKDGVYTAGLPTASPPPLKAISTAQFQQFLQTIGRVYVTPQGT